MYRPHPSDELNALFRSKPYQGVDPMDATFLFIGLDANYAPDVEDMAIFRHLVEYHEDGVAYWRRHEIHHPFLLGDYRGDGRFFHRSFAKIGFRPQHASLVSFIELLHMPTIGRNRLGTEDLDDAHLARIDEAMRNGRARYVFVSSSALRLMRKTKRFAWLPKPTRAVVDPITVLHSAEGRTVYQHLHFSTYGKFLARKAVEAAHIRSLIAAG